jgi:hypothetical protein
MISTALALTFLRDAARTLDEVGAAAHGASALLGSSDTPGR